MAIEKIYIDEFLRLARKYPLLDVRSPSEFKQAHIPGAISLPLFTDEERKIVGTTYKQQSRESAIKIGLDFFGPKMKKMVEEAESIVRSQESIVSTPDYRLPTPGSVLVHCWRGGMRSAGVAWLLDLYGFKVYTLNGGYKKYREHVLQTFELPYEFNILGGFTGSGKTQVLKELEAKGEVIINLEEIAHHKGSAFGAIGQKPQPTQEMFENILSYELRATSHKLKEKSSDLSFQRQGIWLEDESQRIGSVNIPQPLWKTMRSSPVYFLHIPFEERLDHIVKEYGNLDNDKIVSAILRIQKRLGGLETKTAINFLLENDCKECFRILLKYYDKWYLRGLNNRERLDNLLIKISSDKIHPSENADKVFRHKSKSFVPTDNNMING